MKEFWEKFKRDFKERFMNFETAKGIYLLPAGLFIMWTAYYHVQDLIKAAGVLAGGYFVYEGLRKIAVNRIKQGAAKRKLEQEREKIDAGGG